MCERVAQRARRLYTKEKTNANGSVVLVKDNSISPLPESLEFFRHGRTAVLFESSRHSDFATRLCYPFGQGLRVWHPMDVPDDKNPDAQSAMPPRCWRLIRSFMSTIARVRSHRRTGHVLQKQKTHRVHNFVDVRNFALHAISQILIPIIFAMTKFAFAIFHHVDMCNFAHTPRIKRQVLHLPQICNAKCRSCLICNARDFTSS